MKLSRQQALILDAFRDHPNGCETDARGTCMRHIRQGGYRYTERIRELRVKLKPEGVDIIARQIGRGHFHYSIENIQPQGAAVALQANAEPARDPVLFKARHVGNLVREEPST